MRPGLVTPTGIERTFADDEIIVSKTDPRGIITYANDVFVRVSGYAEHELLGAPHSIIRHPDMPRAAFRLLWDTIQAGSEMFAYVVNLAADGAHYWVFAHISPTFGTDGTITGYHSNRRTAPRSAVAQVAPLYAALLAEEQRHAHPVRALEASLALFEQVLAERGQTYDELVWSLDTEAALQSG